MQSRVPVVPAVDRTDDSLHAPRLGCFVVCANASPESESERLDFLLGSEVVKHDAVSRALQRLCAEPVDCDEGLYVPRTHVHAVGLVKHVPTEHKVRRLYAVVDQRAVLERQRRTHFECDTAVECAHQVAFRDVLHIGDSKVCEVAVPRRDWNRDCGVVRAQRLLSDKPPFFGSE